MPVCLFTHSVLPDANIDAKNLPLKRQPFASFENLQIFCSVCAQLPVSMDAAYAIEVVHHGITSKVIDFRGRRPM